MIEVFENSNKIKALKTYAKNKLGLSIDILNCFDKVKHSYSHYKLLVTPFACEVSNVESKIGHWIRVGEIDKYAFSKVNHKLFNTIGIKNY
jgi:adenine-specific DNA glycosylase